MALVAGATILLAACGGKSEPADAQSSLPTANTTDAKQPPSTPADTAIVYDVSWPQCDQPLPAGPTIVGINGELPTRMNPCFTSQVHSAQQYEPIVSLYATAANPIDEAGIQTWPSTGNTPNGVCTGARDTACSYEYGRARAAADIASITKVLSKSDVRIVWLDIEGGVASDPNSYSWGTATPAGQTANRATIHGMADTFKNGGFAVGFYSNVEAWHRIVGNTPDSDFEKADTWLMGTASLNAAHQACENPSFLGDRLVLAQVPAENIGAKYDQNVPCSA